MSDQKKESYSILYEKIEELLRQKNNSVIVIEGGSAGGKTTLSEKLRQKYDCNVFHMDDFFLRPEQRTRERLEETGGNVDRERFFEEVIVPLKEGKRILYRRFDCGTLTLQPAVETEVKPLNIVEGAYSMHPQFGKYYDLSVFLDIDYELQKKRILKRNTPQLAERFFEEWIPMERKYQEQMEIRKCCDVIINIT